MPETKEQLAAERDALLQENARLREDLDRLRQQSAQPAGVQQAQHRFLLSEGDRQEIANFGRAVIGGQLLTRSQVRERLGDQAGNVDLGDDDDQELDDAQDLQVQELGDVALYGGGLHEVTGIRTAARLDERRTSGRYQPDQRSDRD
jgi:hypothetical protein